MSLGDRLKTSLATLAGFQSGEHLLAVADGAIELECRLVALDTIACAFSSLSVRAPVLANMSADELKQVAQKLSSRLTYLLEPISPIEIDSQGCVVQLRSNPPQKEEDRTSYYELLVSRSGAMTLMRYERRPTEGRTVIAAQVTREVLMRLANDFAAVVS